MPELPAGIVHRHAEFFFPDGNIVLVSGEDPTLAFRLHRGIVHRWSPVFRGMLDALEVASDPWTFLGCDALVFDDDPVDFERLIRVLCDGTASVDCSPENFPLLASLLQLSHKYDIPHLQHLTLNRLLAAYPLTLSEWDAREAYAYSPSARHDRLSTLRAQRPHPLVIIRLALRVGAPHLLVPAYLDLARFPVSEIIRGYPLVPSTTSTTISGPFSNRGTAIASALSSPPSHPTLHLPVLQITAVLRGKETLQRFIADFIKASVENRVQSPLCSYIHLQIPGDPFTAPQYPCAAAFARTSHELLVMTAGVSGGIDSDPLFVLKCAVEILKECTLEVAKNCTMALEAKEAQTAVGDGPDKDFLHGDTTEVSGQRHEERPRKEACVACTESFRQTVDLARQHIWNSLPKWFDLRKFIENGFEEGWE